MKKIILSIGLALCVIGLAGCENNEILSSSNNSSSSSIIESDSSSSLTSSSSSSMSSDSSISSDISSSDTTIQKVVISEARGLNEGIYIRWEEVKQATSYNVYYHEKGANEKVLVDEELIRGLEAYLVGLKGNAIYDVEIVPVFDSEERIDLSVTKEIETEAYDRSGYAHFKMNDSIGAYNNDGTLLKNADIIYVTEETKNTVQYQGYTGIGSILKNSSKFTNPVVIRIVGQIYTAQYKYKKVTPRLTSVQWSDEEIQNHFANELENDNVINGITNNVKNANGKTTINPTTGLEVYDDDSYFNMMDVVEAKNITIEGIGFDAECFQWGFTFKKCQNVEVRNLTFTDYPEDACSFEGDNSNPDSYGRYFVHHNTFNRGKNNFDLTGEQDKGYGDGATDIKGVSNVTLAYNHYIKTKKSGLIGGGDSNLQKNITFHHNFYEECGSRLPLGRQANMHIYNNYYYKVGRASDIRKNAYVLSENNYFEECNDPVVIDAKYITSDSIAAYKSIGNIFENCTGKNNHTIVTARDEYVDNTCSFGKTFDIDENLFYYNSVSKKSVVERMTDALQAKSDCLTESGVWKK